MKVPKLSEKQAEMRRRQETPCKYPEFIEKGMRDWQEFKGNLELSDNTIQQAKSRKAIRTRYERMLVARCTTKEAGKAMQTYLERVYGVASVAQTRRQK
jgi:hypothetical protein